MTASTFSTGSEAMQLVDGYFSTDPQSPLIVVLGPTASGKTAFSISLAKTLLARGIRTEVINADSRQFYRFFDIGTAKISEQDMEGIPHHLLSVLDPTEPCSIAWFQEEARRVIKEIRSRAAIPVLVGGSMLYISALIDGFQPIASDSELRKTLSEKYDDDGGTSLMKRLQEVDPVSAAGIPIQNKVYLVRALEIYDATGTPKSELKVQSGSIYDVLMIGLFREPDVLKKSIEERTMKMLTGGWIEEVRLLRASGYTSTHPAMESFGYREISAALDRDDLDLQKLAIDISRKTQQYAKRCMTWWRRDTRIHWLKI